MGMTRMPDRNNFEEEGFILAHVNHNRKDRVECMAETVHIMSYWAQNLGLARLSTSEAIFLSPKDLYLSLSPHLPKVLWLPKYHHQLENKGSKHTAVEDT